LRTLQLAAGVGLAVGSVDAGAADGLALDAAEPLAAGDADDPGPGLCDGAAHCGSGGVTKAPSASSRSDSVA
jgi:hypothetical protein